MERFASFRLKNDLQPEVKFQRNGRRVHKSQKGLPLETKNTKNHENQSLGLIESLHMQH